MLTSTNATFWQTGVIWRSDYPLNYVNLVDLTLANDQLDAQILIHLLESSTYTCFEQYLAHPQEVKLY